MPVLVLAVMGVVMGRLPRFEMPVLALALLLLRQRRRIVGRRDADIVVAEEQADLFERLVLRLGEEEVRDDAVTEVAGHVDEEVSPADVLEGVRQKKTTTILDQVVLRTGRLNGYVTVEFVLTSNP
jgi:hypothetical protein